MVQMLQMYDLPDLLYYAVSLEECTLGCITQDKDFILIKNLRRFSYWSHNCSGYMFSRAPVKACIFYV